MSIARPVEIRLWWPLPLAALVWLIIIWAFGFLLSMTEKETVTPPPIEARFVELPESDRSQEPSPPSPKGTQPQPEISKPAPPLPRPSPPARPPVKPKVIEKIESEKGLPQREQAEPVTPQSAPTDLSEYINQAKARRREAGIIDGLENAPPVAEPQPSADELRLARIKRNLQEPGTSGIFQIVHIGPRFAQFSFRSWTTGTAPTRRVLIEVEAGSDGDVERAIIRRMIELIREYHQGDFNWESHRLNRVIVLSARVQDNEGLEEFLMREFFSSRYTPPYMR
jgi:hypothetical protein